MAMIQRIHGANNYHALAVVAANMARSMGYNEDWVHQQLALGADELRTSLLRYAQQGRTHVGQLAEQAGNALMNRGGRQIAPHGQEQGPMECGFHVNDKGKCPTPAPLPNSTAPTTMNPKRGLDVAPEDERPHDVWHRFPNSEWANLHFRQTYYIGNQGVLVAGAKTAIAGNTSITATGTTNLASTTALTGLAYDTTKNSLGSINTAAYYDFAKPYVLSLRMTTPYSIINDLTDTSTQGGINEPVWISHFDNKYTYYHVEECKWSIDLNFGTPQTATGGTPSGTAFTHYENMELFIFHRYTMEDDPPTKYTFNDHVMKQWERVAMSNNAIVNPAGGTTMATDTTTIVEDAGAASTTNWLTSTDYRLMGGWKVEKVHWNTTHGAKKTISGSYKFGQSKMDLKTSLPSDKDGNDTTTEGWQKVGSAAVMPENLTMIMVWNDTTHNQVGTSALECGVHIHTQHLINFKDLRANFKYPTPQLTNVNVAGATSTLSEEQYFRRDFAH